MISFRAIAAVVVWLALALQYYLVASAAPDGTLAARTLNFFSYFTILSNIAVALAFTCPTFFPASRFGRWFQQANIRAAIALYIGTTGAIYFLILRHTWDPQGLQLLADRSLHYLVPILYLCDWLLFSDKRDLRYRAVTSWMIFPLCYFLYSLIHGAFSGFYPYPFIDVSQLGYARVLLTAGAVLLFFMLLGLGVTAVGRKINR